jgi:hypothetical protein
LGCIHTQRPSWIAHFPWFLLWVWGIHAGIILGASGHIQAVEPSYLADSTHKCCDLTSLHKIQLAKDMDGSRCWRSLQTFYLGIQSQRRIHRGELDCHYRDKEAKGG